MSEIPKSKEIELSNGEYRYPFPDETEVSGIEEDIESHEPPFIGAIDFLVPVGTPVLAARKGTVIDFVDEHSKHGPTRESAEYLNFVQILHDDGEVSDYCHLAKGSASELVKKGKRVAEGQQIGLSGLSGWQDAPCIHFFVSRRDSSEHGFKGLEPRFKGKLLMKETA